MNRRDTETDCHCGADYRGSDHCPECGCEQYESGDCGHNPPQTRMATAEMLAVGDTIVYANGHTVYVDDICYFAEHVGVITNLSSDLSVEQFIPNGETLTIY